jgi:hypothetical protein
MQRTIPNPWRQIAGFFGWTRASYVLMSGFVAIVALIIVVWWPLAEEYLGYIDPRQPLWAQIDWLLIGVFAVMSLLIMVRPDLKRDTLIVAVGLVGGLVIESWGTNTNIWRYFTAERPPLWIVPAWPIASLSIDRLVVVLRSLTARLPARAFRVLYWLALPGFLLLMLSYVWPTLASPFTLGALVLCTWLIFRPVDERLSVITFAAGAGLGYFLEVWGTTRECWTYYTLETPPLFAVFAHGMAALAFWRSGLLVMQLVEHALPATHVLRMLGARLSARGTTGGLDEERAGEG